MAITPVIQFSWTADDVKTIYGVLGAFKIIATQAHPEVIKDAIKRTAASSGESPDVAINAVDQLMEALKEEPHRIRLIQSVMDHLQDWLLTHAASDIDAARRRLGLPDDPPTGGE